MFPREHGAYGQLVFPAVTALAVAGLSMPAVLLALAAACAFVAHEPLLVLLGRRGVRARREEVRSAWRWIAATGGTALASGAAALWLMPVGTRWSLLLPAAPAGWFVAALARAGSKSTHGEVAVALSCSLLAVPLGLASAAPLRTALAVAIPFAAIFVTATLAVRVITLTARGGGPAAARPTRAAALALVVACSAGMTVAGVGGPLPWTALVAAAPGLVAAAALATAVPSAANLRTVGWVLMAIAAAAAFVLAVGLR
jgi:hypothetical protein